MKRKITVCFLVLLCGFSIQSQAQVKKVKHVVLIGCDGLGAYCFEEADIPNMRKMIDKGAWSLSARCLLPSSSAINWASMISGAGSTMHGFTEWGSKTPEIAPVVTNKYGMFPTIFGVIREQRPKSTVGVIYNWAGIGYLFGKETVDLDINTPDLSTTTNKAIEFITSKKPLLTFVHYSEPDHAGHSVGHGTPAYYAAVHKIDSLVGEILTAIEKAGMEDETLIILTSDHGGIEKGHGGKTLAEVQIPWIVYGPGVKKGHQIKNVIMTFDTAATIAYVLGLKTPQAWRGQAVKEAFK